MKKFFLPALLLAVFIFPCIAQSTDTGLTGSWKCKDEFGFTHSVTFDADKSFRWVIGGHDIDGMASGVYSVDGDEITLFSTSRRGNIYMMIREMESFRILFLEKTTLHLKNKSPQNQMTCNDLTFTDWDTWFNSKKEKAPAEEEKPAEEKPAAKEFTGMLGIDFGTDRQTVIDTMTKNGWKIASQSDEVVGFTKPDYKYFNSFVKSAGFSFENNLFYLGAITFYSTVVVDDLLEAAKLFINEYNLSAGNLIKRPGIYVLPHMAQNGNCFFLVLTEEDKAIALTYLSQTHWPAH